MKILLVEDERKIAGFVRKGLEERGFAVEVAGDGNEGYHLATTRTYDAIVLDIMLPGRDGLSILESLRERKNAPPVILLTARGELDDRLKGLDLGADDYMTKPFYVEELAARLRALIRRASGEALTSLQAGNVVLNLIAREAQIDGVAIELTAREFNLLEYLMRSPGRILTRSQILEHVWHYDFDPGTNLIEVHIQHLRKKLADAHGASIIETVRGVGYRIRKEDGENQV
ncbi:MAG: response regulator transcription factor [Candidatus Sumerlaeota bacterium]|nr:response regulator transcription factor [Candidatus Sumerlaeota bacterium]